MISAPIEGHLCGEPCPAFTVPDTHGQPVSAADLRGAPALIIFYPFAFTRICETELAELDERIREFDGVAVLAISCDPPASLRAWQEQQDFAFDMASDFWPHGRAARAFGVFDEGTGHAQRASFVLDAHGTITWSILNPAGRPRSVQAYLEALKPLHGLGAR